METKTRRPDVRMEPLLYRRMKEYCTKRDVPIARWIRDLIIERLRAEEALSPADLRVMRGL